MPETPDGNNITMRIGVDMTNAKKGFDEVEKGLDKVTNKSKGTSNAVKGLTAAQSRANYALLNTTRLVSDMPYLFTDLRLGIMAISNNVDPLVASIQALNTETNSFKGTLKKLGESLIGPAGIGLAISAITGLFLVWSQNSRKAKESTEELTKALDSAAKKQLKLAPQSQAEKLSQQFEVSPEQLDILIKEYEKLYNKEVDKADKLYKKPTLTDVFGQFALNYFGAPNMRSNLITPIAQMQLQADDLNDTVNVYKSILDRLKEIKTEMEANEEVQKRLNELIKSQSDKLKEVSNIQSDKITPKGLDIIPLRGAKTKLSKVEETASKPESPQIAKSLEADYRQMASSITQVFANGLREAWINAFGEANSLLEQFLQALATGIFEAITQNLVGDIMKKLLPGGSILGALGLFDSTVSGSSGGSVAVGSPTQINLMVDGKQLMSTIVEPNLKQSFRRLTRQSIL